MGNIAIGNERRIKGELNYTKQEQLMRVSGVLVAFTWL
jgi:hypothetical protein